MIDFEEQEQDVNGYRHIKLIALAILAIVLVVFLTGCEQAYQKEVTSDYPLTGHLADCSVSELNGIQRGKLTVVRCPNSTTSTTQIVSSGKTRKTLTSVVIDGQSYELTLKEDKK